MIPTPFARNIPHNLLIQWKIQVISPLSPPLIFPSLSAPPKLKHKKHFNPRPSGRDPPNHPHSDAIRALDPARHAREILHPDRLLHPPVLPHRQLQRIQMADLVHLPLVQDLKPAHRAGG